MTATRSPRQATAEALFGSAARGQVDKLSDRDYLIVDDDVTLLHERTAELNAEGWSVASYTFAKLQTLHRKGALFVQHLKDESRIVCDSEGRLRNLLETFSPKKSYADEISANARLAWLIHTRPNTARGHLWACDVLYVALRNFGILRQAERGSFVFSYDGVIRNLIDSKTVSAAAGSTLLKLRLFKALYRSDESFASPQIEATLTRALKHLPRDWFPPVSYAVAPEQVLHGLDALPAIATAYERMRNLEKGLAAACAVVPGFSHSPEALKLMSWIHNPRAYASHAARAEDTSIRTLQKALDLLRNDRSRFAG